MDDEITFETHLGILRPLLHSWWLLKAEREDETERRTPRRRLHAKQKNSWRWCRETHRKQDGADGSKGLNAPSLFSFIAPLSLSSKVTPLERKPETPTAINTSPTLGYLVLRWRYDVFSEMMSTVGFSTQCQAGWQSFNNGYLIKRPDLWDCYIERNFIPWSFAYFNSMYDHLHDIKCVLRTACRHIIIRCEKQRSGRSGHKIRKKHHTVIRSHGLFAKKGKTL